MQIHTRKALKRFADIVFRDCTDRLADRNERAETIRRLSESGQIAIVRDYMDCDCARTTNDVTIVPAVPLLVERAIREFHEDEEGPWSFYFERPSVARQLKRHTRDLAMEAYEDGRPHDIHY